MSSCRRTGYAGLQRKTTVWHALQRARLAAITFSVAVGLLMMQTSYSQVPSKISPKPTPRTPTELQNPRAKEQVQINAVTTATPNTRYRPQFDVRLHSFQALKMTKPRFDNGRIKAKAFTFEVILENAGSSTWAFSNNRLEAILIEGFHDFRRKQVLNPQADYKAIGNYDAVIPVNRGLRLPMTIKLKNRTKPLKKVPYGNPSAFGLHRFIVRSGQRRVKFTPELWYTLHVGLITAPIDEVKNKDGIFMHFRFNKDGNISEKRGPFVYDLPTRINAGQLLKEKF